MMRLPFLLLVGSLLAGCGQGDSRLFLVSRDLAEAIGQKEYSETLHSAQAQDALDRDPAQVALVAGIAERLVEQAKRRYPVGRDWAWEIHVLDSDEVNAFCAAGGKMMVLSGLLKMADNDPDQVAMVVGHEIVHALREHSRGNLSRGWLLESGMWIVAKSLKMGTDRSQVAAQGLAAALRPMDRDQEREADALGLELMADAGFDPARGLEFWRKSLANGGNGGAGRERLIALLSTHPTDQDRVARLSALVKQRQEAKP